MPENLGISKRQLEQARAFYNVATTRTRLKDSPGKPWCWTFPPAPPSEEAAALDLHA